MFCFWKTCFCHSRSGTYYALFLEYSGLKFLPHVCHCVYWVLGEIWAPNSSHKIENNFLFITVMAIRKVRLCVKLFDFFSWVNTHPFDLKFVAFCPKFSGDPYMEFQEKTISGKIFINFVQTKTILYQNCEISSHFLKFYYRSVLRWKNSHKYFHMLFALR